LKNIKLRVIWIVPNICLYLMFIATLIFVVSKTEGIREIGQIPLWILLLIGLFIVSFGGSLRIWQWIVQGKM